MKSKATNSANIMMTEKGLGANGIGLWCRLGRLAVVVLVALTVGCSRSGKGVDNAKRSMYYWRSVFTLDHSEKTFVENAQIGKMYVHFFDVVRNTHGELAPLNTVRFESSVPSGVDIVPVVFIEPGALKDTTSVGSLPGLVVHRIEQMMEQNSLGEWCEMQLDYDWVKSDQQTYFKLLEETCRLLHQKNLRLSVTIRLHQLSLPEPKADYGVLMVYNTGNFASSEESNSILSMEAVAPYLSRLDDYDLPLCAALPIYSWDLLYHTGHFVQIVKGLDVKDSTAFEAIDSAHYRSLQYMAAPTNGVVDNESGRIFPGDVIRHEWASAQTLRQVREALHKVRPTICDQMVLYHLDSKLIKQYDEHEIKNLFAQP